MLVMSVLNKILSKDLQKSWISEMSSRGYIQHMINGLVDDDNQLRDLNPRPEPLRALYIFQSKIVILFLHILHCMIKVFNYILTLTSWDLTN